MVDQIEYKKIEVSTFPSVFFYYLKPAHTGAHQKQLERPFDGSAYSPPHIAMAIYFGLYAFGGMLVFLDVLDLSADLYIIHAHSGIVNAVVEEIVNVRRYHRFYYPSIWMCVSYSLHIHSGH